MTREEVLRMAREAGFTLQRDERLFTEMLERFFLAAAAAGAEAEREACARVCELEAVASSLGHKSKALWQAEVAGRCSAAIRARGHP